jgi:hypothetical protein
LIYYLCTRAHAYTIGVLLRFYPTTLSPTLRILPYEDLFRAALLPRGSFVFTDFDRLAPTTLDRAAALYRHLGQSVPVFNDPQRCPMRFELLRLLHERGVNDFTVYRLNDAARVQRYPVFVRHERGHHKPLTPLLASAAELDRALKSMAARHDPDDLMIVEFCNRLAADGRYRKYGAFRVGDTLYAQHCFMRESWYVKTPRYDGPAADWIEHETYVRDNPHAGRLREIFDLAQIEYGRVDYGVVDGRVQVYEINTNPTVLSDPPEAVPGHDNRVYADMHASAMLRLALPVSGPAIEMPAELCDPQAGNADPEAIHVAVLDETAARLRRHHAQARIKRLVRLLRGAFGKGNADP